MNREIKFRALYEGNWYYQTLEEILSITLAAFRLGKFKTQYTGLKDKNGIVDVCLYEGDILSLDGKIIGNIYESPELHKTEFNTIIPPITSKDWSAAYKIAMDAGFGHAE